MSPYSNKIEHTPSSESMVPLEILAQQPSVTITNGTNRAGYDSDEVTRLLGIGLTPGELKAFKAKRGEFDGDVDRS